MSDPVHDVTLIFASSAEEAERLLELLSDIVCRDLGGRGEGEAHVCGGFICASLGRAPHQT